MVWLSCGSRRWRKLLEDGRFDVGEREVVWDRRRGVERSELCVGGAFDLRLRWMLRRKWVEEVLGRGGKFCDGGELEEGGGKRRGSETSARARTSEEEREDL